MDKQTVMKVVRSVSSASGKSTTASSLSTSVGNSPAAIECRKFYGTREQFLTTFNPSNQLTYCRRDCLERIMLGKAPTLTTVEQAYGKGCAESWMEIQLKNLVNYVGCQERVTSAMIETTAAVIVAEFGFLKVTEIMLFMLRLKSGQFGSVYGKTDGLRITIALRDFLRYRAVTLDLIEMRRKGEGHF